MSLDRGRTPTKDRLGCNLMDKSELAIWLVPVIAGIAVPIGIHFREKQSRSLSYAVVDNRSLLLRHASRFDLSFSFNGGEVRRPWLLVIRVANSGGQPITSEEFEVPITISVGDARVLTGEISARRPSDLAPRLGLREDGVRIEPMLINSRDLFEVQLLLDGSPKEPLLSCRVEGVKKLKEVSIPRTSWNQPWRFGFGDYISAGVFILVGVGLFISIVNGETNPWIRWPLATALGGSLAVAFPLFQFSVLRRSRLFLEGLSHSQTR
ncbi:hypothetical protein FE697_006710 [Mumia zhuanghuii]|uniref:Uncharacterized protein n=2 Tax=Mumia TaxID=1546255 RepID=A0ABW1QKW1_9ACTN|nr:MULTISPECIES: hypothetical protein [Mumia]KAA1423307.1 hypothetical protein FE697_006710 [Mumia zhuanghuii]